MPGVREIMARLRVKNWSQYQHYKDRAPPWIKLHFKLLHSRDWVSASDSDRVLAIASMLIASQDDAGDGSFEADPDYFQRVAYLSKRPDFNNLIRLGFLESASKTEQKQANVSTETETETETETTLSGKPDSPPPEKRENQNPEAREILGFLNAKTGKAFRPVSANLDLITARLKEGYSEQDIRQVIARKCRDWSADDKMAEYLRPATLFNRTNFSQYVGECVPSEAA